MLFRVCLSPVSLRTGPVRRPAETEPAVPRTLAQPTRKRTVAIVILNPNVIHLRIGLAARHLSQVANRGKGAARAKMFHD